MNYYKDPTAEQAVANADRWRNRRNNDLGRWAEKCVMLACDRYRMNGQAEVHKTPEPFQVKVTPSQGAPGKLWGCVPAAKAQPDFQGTLKGGQSIVFEVKATGDGRIRWDRVTGEQADQLDRHAQLGAQAFILCCIIGQFFMVPWNIWHGMKDVFGRRYVTAEDLKEYRIKFDGAAMFLDKACGGTQEGVSR